MDEQADQPARTRSTSSSASLTTFIPQGCVISVRIPKAGDFGNVTQLPASDWAYVQRA